MFWFNVRHGKGMLGLCNIDPQRRTMNKINKTTDKNK